MLPSKNGRADITPLLIKGVLPRMLAALTSHGAFGFFVGLNLLALVMIFAWGSRGPLKSFSRSKKRVPLLV
jgi:hypothetical protein